MRVLVTGAQGFVGRHLVRALQARGHETIAADRHGAPGEPSIDVTDALAVRAAFELARPDAVAHLAGQAFVPASFADPGATFEVNARGTLNVLDAARALAEDGTSPRVLIASSADVYGAQPAQAYPLRESTAPSPANPYAASKVAAEALAVAYARSFGLDVVATRAFNHIGPGQDERFAVAAFARQIAAVARAQASVVWVGNLEASRDFLDVRDVCAAYVALLEGGGDAGEIYNICSGQAVALRDVLRRLVSAARIAVEIREDPARMRPSDVPLSVGDAAKLRAATGWAPARTLDAALRDVYADALARLDAQGGGVEAEREAPGS